MTVTVPVKPKVQTPITRGPVSVGLTYDRINSRQNQGIASAGESVVPQIRSPRFAQMQGRSRGFVGVPVGSADSSPAPSTDAPFANGAFRSGTRFVTPIIGAGASANLTPIEKVANRNNLDLKKGPVKSSDLDETTKAYVQKGIDQASKDGYFGATITGKGSVTSGTMRIDTHRFTDLNGKEHETFKERNSTDVRHLLTNYLPENKKLSYYYILGKDGKAAAEKYLDDIKINDMEKPVMSSIESSRAERFAEKHPVLSKAAAFLLVLPELLRVLITFWDPRSVVRTARLWVSLNLLMLSARLSAVIQLLNIDLLTG